jgi:TolB-like protein
MVENDLSYFRFFTSLSTGVSIPFSACYQKSGASIFISLVSSDLNFVLEKVQELCVIAYSTFLAFLDKISSIDWLKKSSSPPLFSKNPTIPFFKSN